MNKLIQILKKINISKKQELPYSLMPLLYDKIKEKEILHSNIISSLISKTSGNKSWEVFLRNFLSTVGVEDVASHDLSDANVHKEYGIEDSRRIDILITWNKFAVIVENKLNDAADLNNQMHDYYKAVNHKPHNPNESSNSYEVLKIVYMPLYETKKPPNLPIEIENKITNIYPADLKNWLKKCFEELQSDKQGLLACENYIELFDYINLINRNCMEARNILKELSPAEIEKLSEITKLMSSSEWEKVLFEILEKEVKEKFKNCKTSICSYKENKSFLQIWLDNYRFWIEIYTWNHKFYLYAVTRDETETAKGFFQELNMTFNISEKDKESKSSGKMKHFYKFSDEKPAYLFDFSNSKSEDNNNLITDIGEMLKKSIE